LATVDITIKGAGIFGLSIAFECVRQGARVRVIDPNRPGGGASGGVVGALAPHTPERWEPKKQFQLESLLMAEGFWHDVDQISGRSSGYGRTGRLQPIADENLLALSHERAHASLALWHGHATWQVRPQDDFGAWVPSSPTGWLVYDTLTARIDPMRAYQSLAAALTKMGADITSGGPEQGQVIWATGYQGLLDLSAAFRTEVGNGVKGQAALFKFDAGDTPQVFTTGIHFIPHNNGTLGIGSTSERYWNGADTTDDQLDALIDRARQLCPSLVNAPLLAKWAGVRPRAKTRAPILGEYPDKPGHFIANGGFKIGFGMAPKVSAIMANLVLNGVNDIPAEFSVAANL